MPESELEIASRHVREGEAHVAAQLAIIAKFEREGHERAAALARDLLRIFEDTLATHRRRLEMVRRLERDG
jgi:hypothetical protein